VTPSNFLIFLSLNREKGKRRALFVLTEYDKVPGGDGCVNHPGAELPVLQYSMRRQCTHQPLIR
jgi:hypothetical protein